MVQWLEIAAGIIGAIGVICAFVLGYRAPRNTEPVFDLRFDDLLEDGGAIRAALIATNPSDRPILLRSLVIQNPSSGVFFLSDAPGRGRTGAFETNDGSDVLAIDLEVPPEQSSEIDFYVGRERSSARDFAVDVEFSTSRLPSVVRSENLRARLPSGAEARRATVATVARHREAPAP